MSTRTLNLDDRTYAYLLAHGVREPDVARRLRQFTADREDARMQISPEQGQLIDWLVRLLGPRRGIEVGTFTGYSALRTALAMPEDGRLLCCDLDQGLMDIASTWWREANVAHKISVRVAPALETLDLLLDEDTGGTWDWIFLDADKESYPAYVERAWWLLRAEGVCLIDNVLWSGAVADPDDERETTVALRAVNLQLSTDARWDVCMLPIGDGLTLLRKRPM